MSVNRYISSSFWDDRWIQTLNPSEKLLYLYLLSNPLTNIAGVYKIEDRRISFDTGFSTDIVNKTLVKFETAGKAYRIDEYIAIPAWPKHQKWDRSPKIKEGIVSVLKEIGKKHLDKLTTIGYKFDLKIVYDTLSIPYTYCSNYSNLNSDININSDLSLSTQSEPINLQDFPTACAVDQKEIIPVFSQGNKVAPVSKPPLEKHKKRGKELTDEQKPLFHAAKACFESSEKAKALMYQDKGSTQMQMECLKLFVVRCSNMAPGITADFMRNVLEHFRALVNGRLKNKGVDFTPRAITTHWIWETVISTLPDSDNDLTEETRAKIRGMFK